MLTEELRRCLSEGRTSTRKSDYYNDELGDTSFLLAGLLDNLLKLRPDWDLRKWIDDSLVTELKLNQNLASISGVMIWGRRNVSEQWTSPFNFQIEFSVLNDRFVKYSFLFDDVDRREVSYEEFRSNRSCWAQSERNWKYVINRIW
jgi:hypothetical protein